MLKAMALVNNRRTLFLGLSRENTRRLHEGLPIAVDAQALAQMAQGEPVQDIVLFAGETEEACAAELAQYFPGATASGP